MNTYTTAVWDYEIGAALIRAGLVEGTIDSFGYVLEISDDFPDVVSDAIRQMAGIS
jgi:hypothetical protein